MEQLTPTQLTLAGLAIAVIFGLIGAWLGKGFGFGTAFVQAGKLLSVIQTAVLEAEKMYNATDEEKYKAVANVAALTAKDMGLPIDAQFIELLITGVVKLLRRRQTGTIYSGDK